MAEQDTKDVGSIEIKSIDEHDDGSATVHIIMDEIARNRIIEAGFLALLIRYIDSLEESND